MNEKSLTPYSADEIDLVVLLEKIILYFKKYRLHYIVALLVGAALGIMVWFIFPKLYKSRMILHSSYVTNSEQLQIIDNWNELLKRNEYDRLTAEFNCSPEILHKLSKIEGGEIQKVFTPNNPNGFYVDVKVTDNSVLPDLQTAIVYGLNNTPYMKNRVAMHKEDVKKLIDKVNAEISKVDSTKKTIENIISNKEKNSSSLMLDVTGINAQVIALNEKLIGYEEDLQFSDGVNVVQGFIPFNTPVSFSWKVLILLGCILAVVVTYLYTLFHQVNEKLKHSKLPAP